MTFDLDLDVLVVGGGPAGAACATVLAQAGACVGLVESGNFEQFRIGETIQASARPLLARLGCSMSDQTLMLPAHGVASAWGNSTIEVSPSIMNPHGRGWRVDRLALDRRLFDNAGAAGALIFTSARVESDGRHSRKWEFSIVCGGTKLRGTAPLVVEATGRNGKSKFAPRPLKMWLDRLIGLAVFNEGTGPPNSSFRDSPLVESTPLGWWYSVNLPNQGSLGVFFTDSDLLPRNKAQIGLFLEEQLEATEHTRARCDFNNKTPCGWRPFDARSGIRRCAMAEGWVAVGDALMSFDPLSGRGVTEALSSGIAIADWLKSRASSHLGEMPQWVEEASSRFNEYCWARRLTYGAELRWEKSPFWRRRQAGVAEEWPPHRHHLNLQTALRTRAQNLERS